MSEMKAGRPTIHEGVDEVRDDCELERMGGGSRDGEKENTQEEEEQRNVTKGFPPGQEEEDSAKNAS